MGGADGFDQKQPSVCEEREAVDVAMTSMAASLQLQGSKFVLLESDLDEERAIRSSAAESQPSSHSDEPIFDDVAAAPPAAESASVGAIGDCCGCCGSCDDSTPTNGGLYFSSECSAGVHVCTVSTKSAASASAAPADAGQTRRGDSSWTAECGSPAPASVLDTTLLGMPGGGCSNVVSASHPIDTNAARCDGAAESALLRVSPVRHQLPAPDKLPEPYTELSVHREDDSVQHSQRSERQQRFVMHSASRFVAS